MIHLAAHMPLSHVQNLLDLAHAPFTHTSTFAKGWPIPEVVRFKAEQVTLVCHQTLRHHSSIPHEAVEQEPFALAHHFVSHTVPAALSHALPPTWTLEPVSAADSVRGAQMLAGMWEPYPIDMAFQPPCMVLSTIGLAQPGKIRRVRGRQRFHSTAAG